MKVLSDAHKESIKQGMLAYFDKKGRTGTITKNGYKAIRLNGVIKYEHRLIWEQAYGEIPKGYQIHHINHNKLDNRLENLEMISNSDHQKQHSVANKLGLDRQGVEPTNKTPIEIREKIIALRQTGMLLKDICKEVSLSYPTVLKYAKGVA